MVKGVYIFLPIIIAMGIVCIGEKQGFTELIVHLEFEGNFDDSSGTGINGTPGGDAAIIFDAARDGQVLSLDGDDDIVTLSGDDFFDAGFDLLAEMTIAMWVYTEQELSDVAFSGGMNTFWAPGGVHFKLNNGLVNVGINGSPPDVVGTTVLPVGEWHHIALTLSATEIAVYYDGVQEGMRGETEDLPFFDMFLTPVIGAWRNNDPDGEIQREWLGMKDDFRIYDEALSAEEVQALFESTAADGSTGVNNWPLH